MHATQKWALQRGLHSFAIPFYEKSLNTLEMLLILNFFMGFKLCVDGEILANSIFCVVRHVTDI